MASEFIRALTDDPGITLAALIITVGCLTGLLIAGTAIVMGNWRRVRQTEELNALKQYMLEQGMSAEEIATVISASPRRRRGVPQQVVVQ